MAEDKELVLPAGLDDMGADPLDRLRLRPALLPSDIIPLSIILHLYIRKYNIVCSEYNNTFIKQVSL